jgi:hypothetical protein
MKQMLNKQRVLQILMAVGVTVFSTLTVVFASTIISDSGVITNSLSSNGDIFSHLSTTTIFNGNVGIGTTTPQAKLDVAGTIAGDGVLQLRGINSSNAAIWFEKEGEVKNVMQLANDGSSLLVQQGLIVNAGSVGIGTTTPIRKLQVESSSGWGNIVSSGSGSGLILSYPAEPDYGKWMIYPSINSLTFGAANDALDVNQVWMWVDRSGPGGGVESINFEAHKHIFSHDVFVGTGTAAANLVVNGALIASSSSISSINFAQNTSFTSNNYNLTFNPPITQLQKGFQVTFIATSANSGACNLVLSDLAVSKPLKIQHDQDPTANYIEAGSVVVAVYDGATFQMIQPDANPNTIPKPTMAITSFSVGVLTAGINNALSFYVMADASGPANLKKFTVTPQFSGVSGVTISGVYDTGNPGVNLISAPIAISSGVASPVQLIADLPVPAVDLKELLVKVNVGSMGGVGTNQLQLQLTSSDTEYIGSDWQWNNTLNWPYYNSYKMANHGSLPLSGPVIHD